MDWETLYLMTIIAIAYIGAAFGCYLIGRSHDARGVGATFVGIKVLVNTLEQRFITWAEDFTARNKR